MSGDGQLLERLDNCPTQADLLEWAEDCNCDVWVIEGEHAGIGYDRPAPKTEPEIYQKPRLVFGQPIPDEYLKPKPPGM